MRKAAQEVPLAVDAAPVGAPHRLHPLKILPRILRVKIVEGEDWEYTTDGKLHRIKTDWPMAGYTQGNYFIRTQLDTEVESQDAEIKALNEGATMSPVLGFAFDTSNVADQLTACIEIYNRYKAELLTGTLDPEEQVAAMMEEMRSNGFDEIVAEAQAQIDAYFAG